MNLWRHREERTVCQYGKEHLDEIKTYTTWVEAERLFWAVTDTDGNPVEMPKERINQVWNIYGTIEEKHFQLKEFQGKWDDILQPNYTR